MQLITPKGNYSRITLQIKDPSLHSHLWEFTIEELLLLRPYVTFVYSLALFAVVLQTESKVFVVVAGIAFCYTIIGQLLAAKYKMCYLYSLLVHYIIMLVMLSMTWTRFKNYDDTI